MLVIVVAGCGGGEDAGDFRALADYASRPPSTTTSSTTTTTTTTTAPPTTAPTTTVPPESEASDPGTPSANECQDFLNEVLSAGRPPSSGETQYLYVNCGIDIDDYYPSQPSTEIGLTPGGPCELGSHRDCIDPDGDGIGTYLLGGGDCMAQSPPSPELCADLDLDGVAGYPDSG